jgi:hypothetical protein
VPEGCVVSDWSVEAAHGEIARTAGGGRNGEGQRHDIRLIREIEELIVPQDTEALRVGENRVLERLSAGAPLAGVLEDVCLESAGRGRGSTFRFTLPVAEAVARALESTSHRSS